MACGACSSRVRARSGTQQTLYKVMVNSNPERVAFQTHDPALAKTVARNYSGSRIDPDPDASTKPAATPDPTTVEQADTTDTEPTTTS
jgi:hypothetical protein